MPGGSVLCELCTLLGNTSIPVRGECQARHRLLFVNSRFIGRWAVWSETKTHRPDDQRTLDSVASDFKSVKTTTADTERLKRISGGGKVSPSLVTTCAFRPIAEIMDATSRPCFSPSDALIPSATALGLALPSTFMHYCRPRRLVTFE